MRLKTCYWYCDDCDSSFLIEELDSYSCPNCSGQLVELEEAGDELPKRSLSVGSEDKRMAIGKGLLRGDPLNGKHKQAEEFIFLH